MPSPTLRTFAFSSALLASFALGTCLPRMQAALRPSSPNPQATAATPLKSGRIPEFENDDVRVYRSIIVPGSTLAMHRHDHGHVVIPLQGGTINTITPDGKKEVQVWERGHAYWYPIMPPGAMHADINTGTEPIEVFSVELKKDK